MGVFRLFSSSRLAVAVVLAAAIGLQLAFAHGDHAKAPHGDKRFKLHNGAFDEANGKLPDGKTFRLYEFQSKFHWPECGVEPQHRYFTSHYDNFQIAAPIITYHKESSAPDHGGRTGMQVVINGSIPSVEIYYLKGDYSSGTKQQMPSAAVYADLSFTAGTWENGRPVRDNLKAALIPALHEVIHYVKRFSSNTVKSSTPCIAPYATDGMIVYHPNVKFIVDYLHKLLTAVASKCNQPGNPSCH